jgi:hypothetical protein
MIDYNHLPNIDQTISIFTTAGSTAWQTWQKPRGCKFVYMFVIGGGAGGGGGQTGTGVNRTGGGGGGSSGVNKGMFLANTLPDTLYINVGVGGTAGAPNGNGGNGAFSYVSVAPNTLPINVVLLSNSTTVPTGGTAGGGNTGGVVLVANQILSFCGVSQFSAGQNGVSGGLGTGGPGTSVTMANIITGGAGGGGASTGGINGSGGAVTLGNALPTILGGAAGGTNNGQNGYCGIEPNKTNILRDAFVFTGGAGGGANATGIGGNGGDGAYGCGGGGGGAGTTGGRGGRGGDGLVIIISY